MEGKVQVLRKSAIDKSDCIKGGGGEGSPSCAAGLQASVCVWSASPLSVQEF